MADIQLRASLLCTPPSATPSPFDPPLSSPHFSALIMSPSLASTRQDSEKRAHEAVRAGHQRSTSGSQAAPEALRRTSGIEGEAQRAFAVVGSPSLLPLQRALPRAHDGSPLARGSYVGEAGQHGGSLSREEAARTLPRRFNVPSLSPSKDYQRRGGMPSGFAAPAMVEQSPSSHTRWQQSRSPSGTPLPVQQQCQSQPQHWPGSEIPPTPPQQSINTFGSGIRVVLQPSTERVSWHSDGSTPTLRANGAAQAASQAHIHRQVELAPVPLTRPAGAGSARPQEIQMPGTDVSGSSFTQPGEHSRSSTFNGSAIVRPESSTLPNLTPSTSAQSIPSVRTDFANMRRFSLSHPSTQPTDAAAALGGALEAKVATTPKLTVSLPASPAARGCGPSVGGSSRVESVGARSAPVAGLSSPTKPGQVARKPVPTGLAASGPGGHVMDRQNVALLLLADGGARPVCSPTPARLTAADGSGTERSVKMQPERSLSPAQMSPNSASRDTFGPGASMFQHANDFLTQHAKTQGDAEKNLELQESHGAQASLSVPIGIPRPAAARRPSEATVYRSSFSSDATAFDLKRGSSMELQRSSSSRARKRGGAESEEAASLTSPRRGNGHGRVVPPSAVPETREPSVAREEARSEAGHKNGSILRFIQIIKSARPGSAQTRPGTAQSRVSAKSAGRHANSPACRQCFRAGFDCAMELQLGEGTLGRQAFQNFVSAGGLNALSAAGGGADADSLTCSRVLGRNFVDKLGEVAFGESAISRPVTRGRVEDMLEERGRSKEDVESPRPQTRDGHVSFHRVFEALEAWEAPLTPDAMETSRASRCSTCSSHTDQLSFLADRWPAWRKCMQIGICCLWLFVTQAFDAGFVSTVKAHSGYQAAI